MRGCRPALLVPVGFAAESVETEGDTATIRVCAVAGRGICPSCGRASFRVHSRYHRRLADLPAGGRMVRLVVLARRFYCREARCNRQIFAERFRELAPWARRTARLDTIVQHLGLALGGRPAAGFARRLMIPVSNDTLLRVVRQRGRSPLMPPRVVGVDDWAWRRNFRYGTIVCDLERRRTIALLPDREPVTTQAWLAGQAQIEIVARDRGGGYALAAARALPHATQVADRWHLMENASHAFLNAVRKSMRQIRQAIGAATINPELLTSAERLQYDSYVRREETNAVISDLAKDGLPIKAIVRRTGHSRKLVRDALRGQRTEIFRARQSSIEPYLPWLDEQWGAGQRNGAELWRQLRQKGFQGSLRVVGEWASRRRKAEQAERAIGYTPAARTIARLMTIGRDSLNKAEAVTLAAIETGVPRLTEARDIIAAFQSMIRRKCDADLVPWLARAHNSLVASFAAGVLKDQAAIRMAITSPWSNGQTEGQITKLKLVKRQMYGRGKLDLLEARLIGPM